MIPTSSDQVMLRVVTGGIVSTNARIPSRIPSVPTEEGSKTRERTRSTLPT